MMISHTDDDDDDKEKDDEFSSGWHNYKRSGNPIRAQPLLFSQFCL